MNRRSGIAIRAIQKHVEPCRMSINETNTFKCHPYAIEIFPADDKVDVLRRPHRLFVDLRHPCRDRVPPRNRVGNARLL